MLFTGDDWAESHHDIEIQEETGLAARRRRFSEGIDGLAALHALIADQLEDDAEPAEVLVGIETDRGPWVQALIAWGYTVYAVNPLQAGGPLPGTARRLRGQERSRRCPHPGRAGPAGPGPSPPGGR
jgi:hypothetical protein